MPTNRFTTMRHNVEYALENSATVAATGLSVHKWSSARQTPASDAKAFLKAGLIVSPEGIDWDPYAYNAGSRFTQRIRIGAWLPDQAGTKAEAIEEIIWAICVALAGLTREDMHESVAGIERVTVKGGDMGVTSSTDEDRSPRTDDVSWSHVCAVEIVHTVMISELQEPVEP